MTKDPIVFYGLLHAKYGPGMKGVNISKVCKLKRSHHPSLILSDIKRENVFVCVCGTFGRMMKQNTDVDIDG